VGFANMRMSSVVEGGKAMSLAGKTIFMSGGSRGIGLAIALRAARDGANVAIAAKTAAGPFCWSSISVTSTASPPPSARPPRSSAASMSW